MRHPLRKVRQIVNEALASLDAESDRLHAAEGRRSIAPERLLRASPIQILFSVRSERQLMEQMQYNLLFCLFVGLGVDDPAWGEGRPEICPVDRFPPRTGEALGRRPTVFTKNRDRLRATDPSRKAPAAIPGPPRGGAAAVGWAPLGRRHAGEGPGVDGELPPQG